MRERVCIVLNVPPPGCRESRRPFCRELMLLIFLVRAWPPHRRLLLLLVWVGGEACKRRMEIITCRLANEGVYKTAGCFLTSFRHFTSKVKVLVSQPVCCGGPLEVK